MGVSGRDEEEIRVGSAALLTTRAEGGGVKRPGRANGCFLLSPARLRRLLPHKRAVTVVESRYMEASRADDTLPWLLRNALLSRDFTTTMNG